MLYLGWVIAAFLVGYLFCYWRTDTRKAKETLRERCSHVEWFRGMQYEEVLKIMKHKPRYETVSPNGQIRRTWSEKGYFITLCFDTQNHCLGIESEELK